MFKLTRRIDSIDLSIAFGLLASFAGVIVRLS